MGSTLRFTMALSSLLVACATKGSGLDSESHFACSSDTDCTVHVGRTVCVEHVCEPSDAATKETGGSGGGGGGGAQSTSGGTGGTSSIMPDATPPTLPEAGLPAVDGGICQKCTRDLTPEQSLACYCRAHSCDADLATALANPKWESVDQGCNLVVVHVDFGRGLSGQMEAFDGSGRLVGAMKWNDVFGPQCISPNDGSEGEAAGGNYFLPQETTCNSTTTCTLAPSVDGGPGRCDVNALLSEAGPPCAPGEVRTRICNTCLTCDRVPRCVRTCTTNADCTAPDVCMGSLCQQFCPF